MSRRTGKLNAIESIFNLNQLVVRKRHFFKLVGGIRMRKNVIAYLFILSCLLILSVLLFKACRIQDNGQVIQEESVMPSELIRARNIGVWSICQSNNWYAKQGWLTGADYIPSNAVNQLEMWQKATFSPNIIDKEFQLAEGIGYNTMRVYLHSIVWKDDAEGFKNRIDQFLTVAQKHHIRPMFVFFDDRWNRQGYAGKQPTPKAGVHNSGWVQDPGQPASVDTANFYILEKYVTDILETFKHDPRILAWDLYNEPGNSGKENLSFPLLQAVFQWAHAVRPDQPLTAGLWKWDLEDLNKFQIANSDIITYHDYENPNWHKRVVDLLKSYGKPLICTEYMARTKGSLFNNILPMLKAENVGAINWGFVAGKTNTIYARDSLMPDGQEPKLWLHDIFRQDYTAYRQDEVDLIKKLNGR